MIHFIILLITKTPFYPHWLEFQKLHHADLLILKYINGRVIETGAGTSQRKHTVLRQRPRITEYLATDYSSWDDTFELHTQRGNLLSGVGSLLFGKSRKLYPLDRMCDAMNIPFKNNSFDTYVSFQVLEHITDIQRYFAEASRVIKPGGFIIVSTPFLYRDHGGKEKDFQRLTQGGFHVLAKTNGLVVKKTIVAGFAGTTLTSMMNGYVIRKLFEAPTWVRMCLFIVSPFIFFVSNVGGFIIDAIDQDWRFATHHYIVMKKNKHTPRSSVETIKKRSSV